jgi:formamidopyrimidine-DNA glycosylase
MPELPEVETFRRYFKRTSLKQSIKKVEVRGSEMLWKISSQRLRFEMQNHHFVVCNRHGKYLFAGLENHKCLVLHFGMTGYLKYLRDAKESLRHVRLVIAFENGCQLAFVCQRKLGKIAFTEDPKDFRKQRKLGPDALSVGFSEFQRILAARRGPVKSVLMNQQIIAGIGNLYADEILFQSRIHPAIAVTWLSRQQLNQLFECMKFVLTTVVKRRADWSRLPENFLLPVREKEGRCPLCGKKLSRIRTAGRTGYYCPHHQKMK